MTVGRGPRLGADGVNAINEELVGRGLHFWLLAPQSGVWKLLGQPAGRSTDVTNYVRISPPGFLDQVMAKKRI